MSNERKERQQQRQSDFKKGIDTDDARRSRDEGLMSLRKNKREDKLAKRRQAGPPSEPSTPQQAASLAASSAPQEMQQWIVKLNGGSFEEVFAATQHFRKLLSLEKNPPIQKVIDAGITPKLVHLCTATQYPKLQYEAAWALTNIASGTSSQTKAVIDANAVPVFIQLLRSPDESVREQAIWALGNIAGDSPSNRDSVLKAGAMPSLLENIKHATKVSMTRNATWALSNFIRGKPQPPFELVSVAVPALAYLANSNDDEVLTDACWALSYLSDGSAEKLKAVADCGVLPRLIALLAHKNLSIQTPALRTIGNIATGDDSLTDRVVQGGAVPALVAMCNSTRKGIRKEAMWTLSNITAGTQAQIQTVVEAGGVPEIIRQLRDGEWEIKKEAAWAVSNFTSGGTPEQIRVLVAQGVIKPLCDTLTVKDPKIVTVALEAINHILRNGESGAGAGKFNTGSSNRYADMVEDSDGLDKIESLQEHPNEKVYEKAVSIIERFFADEDEGENFFGAAQQQNGQFAFGGGDAPKDGFGAAPGFGNNASFNFASQAPQQQAAFAGGGGGGFNF